MPAVKDNLWFKLFNHFLWIKCWVMSKVTGVSWWGSSYKVIFPFVLTSFIHWIKIFYDRYIDILICQLSCIIYYPLQDCLEEIKENDKAVHCNFSSVYLLWFVLPFSVAQWSPCLTYYYPTNILSTFVRVYICYIFMQELLNEHTDNLLPGLKYRIVFIRIYEELRSALSIFINKCKS